MPTEVADRGGITLAHLDQPGGGNPLERFPDGRPGHTEHLGEPALTGKWLAGLHFPAEHAGEDLLEDVLGNGTPVHRLQGHDPSLPEDRTEVKWSDQWSGAEPTVARLKSSSSALALSLRHVNLADVGAPCACWARLYFAWRAVNRSVTSSATFSDPMNNEYGLTPNWVCVTVADVDITHASPASSTARSTICGRVLP